MYQYKGYMIQFGQNDNILLRDSKGKFLQEFDTEKEAEYYVDHIHDIEVRDFLNVSNTEVQKPIYYLYRIKKRAVDTYINYQYFNGRWFSFGVDNIKYMAKDDVDSKSQFYNKKKDGYNYHVSKRCGY